jgi:hypothetical protein
MTTIYRITRFPKASTIADSVAMLCAKSNGMDVGGKITIEQIESYIACEIVLFPFSNRMVSVTKINDCQILIDQDCEPLLEIIEEPEFSVPTLDTYDQSAN